MFYNMSPFLFSLPILLIQGPTCQCPLFSPTQTPRSGTSRDSRRQQLQRGTRAWWCGGPGRSWWRVCVEEGGGVSRAWRPYMAGSVGTTRWQQNNIPQQHRQWCRGLERLRWRNNEVKGWWRGNWANSRNSQANKLYCCRGNRICWRKSFYPLNPL